MTQYYQCDLTQGTARTKAYIEARGAKVGHAVEVKEEGFEGFWTVTQVADKAMEVGELRNLQKINRNLFGSILDKV